jgi:four helix bundle protein
VEIRSFKDLKVWQTSVDLAVAIYGVTKAFPREELYGLTSQLRRCSASVAANIAEGHGRESTGSFVQFLRVAQGSLKELETHLIIAERVGLLPVKDHEALSSQCGEIGRMIRALVRKLQEKQ